MAAVSVEDQEQPLVKHFSRNRCLLGLEEHEDAAECFAPSTYEKCCILDALSGSVSQEEKEEEERKEPAIQVDRVIPVILTLFELLQEQLHHPILKAGYRAT